MHYAREPDQFIYSYFEKGCRKKCAKSVTTFLEIAVYWSPIDLGNYCFGFRLEKEKFQLNRSFYILFIFFFSLG